MKPKKCKICSDKFTPTRAIQPTCDKYDCKLEYALKHSKRFAEKRIKERNKRLALEKKELREKVKTLSDWLKDLQTNINLIVRLIDKGCGCICTGSTNGKMNAGHFRSVGSHPTLRYHLDNIHLQSEHSNTYLSGDTLRYQQGLKNIYGEAYFEYVSQLSLIPPIKLTIDDIKEKIVISKAIIKELKDKDCAYNPQQRLELRKEYNNKLGIYK